MVRVASGGDATPLPPAATPETVTDLLLPSVTASSFAVTVTTPLLAVALAAMVSVVPVRVKSPTDPPVPGAA